MAQSEVPSEPLGRASSLDWFVSLGVSPTGLVVAGQLSSYVGVRWYLAVMGLATSLPGPSILVPRRINAIDRERVSTEVAAAR